MGKVLSWTRTACNVLNQQKCVRFNVSRYLL